MKIIKILALLLLVVIGWIAVFQGDKVERLYHTMTLFDGDKIVHNFSNMRDVAPTVEIKPSTDASKFESQPAPLPTAFTYKSEQGVEEYLARTSTTALLVLKDGAVTYEEYFQGTKDTDYRISWSVAKSFLSALFGIAVEEGDIKSIEQTVTEYVPELVGTGYDGVRIKDVLQMSSGVAFNEDYYDFNSDINRFGRTFALGGSFDDFAASLKNEKEPGTFLHYVSIDTHVLGMVLRAATGREIADYFDDKLWSKIEPESSTYYIVDDENEPMVLGGLNMRTRDFARFGLLYLNNGKWKDEQVIPEAWVKASVTPDAQHLVPGERDNSYINLGYGYQWWIPENADQEFYAIGIYGQFIYVNQKANVVIVKNSAHLEFADNDYESFFEVIAFCREVVKSLEMAES